MCCFSTIKAHIKSSSKVVSKSLPKMGWGHGQMLGASMILINILYALDAVLKTVR